MLTMKWQVDIPDETYYNKLIASGMAYEFYPDLPNLWSDAEKEILAYQAKVGYCRTTRSSNFEASCKLEGIE